MTDAIRLLQELVSIASVNPMGRPVQAEHRYEWPLTSYLEDFFRRLGLAYERQPVAPWRENIVAFFEPERPTGRILFEVHQDTVPAEDMTVPPFAAQIVDGKLFGRGACDVKGAMAAMLAVLARLVRERPRQAAALTLACVVDEEYTFTGVQELVRRGLRADLAIVAEPTRLQVVVAHKGAVRFRIHTEGRACHSSQPWLGTNAILRMGRVLTALEEYADGLRRQPADPLLGLPTLNVGVIQGGITSNIVPHRCTIELDRRLLPNESPQQALEDVMAYVRRYPRVDFPVLCEPPWLALPGLDRSGNSEAARRLSRAVAKVLGTAEVAGVPYGTDASTLAAAGIPSVVFGPGDIAQAHTADEWVSIAQVRQAEEILYHLVTDTA
ncbi:MAG: acetylornithine deacetylase [Gemmataceae bacterium]